MQKEAWINNCQDCQLDYEINSRISKKARSEKHKKHIEIKNHIASMTTEELIKMIYG